MGSPVGEGVSFTVNDTMDSNFCCPAVCFCILTFSCLQNMDD